MIQKCLSSKKKEESMDLKIIRYNKHTYTLDSVFYM